MSCRLKIYYDQKMKQQFLANQTQHSLRTIMYLFCLKFNYLFLFLCLFRTRHLNKMEITDVITMTKMESVTKLASWDVIIETIVENIGLCLNYTNAVNQPLHGHELIQFAINAINIRCFSPDLPGHCIDKFMINILVELSNQLQLWKINHSETIFRQVELMSLLNVPHCCEMILTQVIKIIDNTITMTDSIPLHPHKNKFLQGLSHIKVQIEETVSAITQNISYSTSFDTTTKNFHFTTTLFDEESLDLPRPYKKLVRPFTEHPLPKPLIMKPVHSPMMEMLAESTRQDIIDSARFQLCRTCGRDLRGARAVSFLPHCTHVYCRGCAVKWVLNCNKANQDW